MSPAKQCVLVAMEHEEVQLCPFSSFCHICHGIYMTLYMFCNIAQYGLYDKSLINTESSIYINLFKFF